MESGIDLLQRKFVSGGRARCIYIPAATAYIFTKTGVCYKIQTTEHGLANGIRTKEKIIFVMFDYLFARYLHQQLHHIKYVFIVFKNK